MPRGEQGMFIVKKVTTLEQYCLNGHTPLSDLLPQSNHSIRFCHICGLLLMEGQVLYDAAYCANCNNRVEPRWDYCPYCGQGREG